MKEIIKVPKSQAEKIKSVLVVVVVFMLLSVLSMDKKPQMSIVFLYLGCGIGLFTLLNKYLLDGFIWLWFGLASILGFIVSRILLTAVFYLFLSPLAMLSKLTSKDPLKLRRPEGSNFIERNHTYKLEDIRNIW